MLPPAPHSARRQLSEVTDARAALPPRSGHLSQKTIKAVSFVGPDDALVAGGSDCGRVFLWERDSGEERGGGRRRLAVAAGSSCGAGLTR